MLTIIDSFLLNKDVSSWYETILDEYQDYYNPVFDIRIKLEYVSNDFLISVHRANTFIVAVYTYELYSTKTDQEILDHLLKMVWEMINEKQ
jgi:hypothetical protein